MLPMQKPKNTFAGVVRDGLNTSITEKERRVEEITRERASPPLDEVLVKELRSRRVFYKRERTHTRGCIQAKKVRNNKIDDNGNGLDKHWQEEYDIKVHLEFLLDLQVTIPASFLEKHREIDEQKRNKVIHWINNICSRFVCYDEIFHLTLSIFDRFLAASKVPCPLNDLQGYCFAAFKIALRHVNTFNQECNYGYIFRPDVSSTEYPYLLETETATDGASTKAEGVTFERTILKIVQWNLQVPTVLTYFYEIMAILDLSDTIQNGLMINVIHLLKSQFSYSVSIIDQPPLAKVAALILHVTEHLIQAELENNELINLKKRLVQFADDYGITESLQVLHSHFILSNQNS